MKRTFLSAILPALALAAPLAAQTYQITDIGLLDGAPTYATAVNDNGVVCGYALPDASSAKAWVFDNAVLTELPGLGGSDTRAMALAFDGRVYGYATDTTGLAHAVRWENGALTDLGPASGTDGWLPQAVNASGLITGHTGNATAPVSAFTLSLPLSLPSFASLPTLPGATSPSTNAAYDLNDSGIVVGVSSWVGGGTRAFRTDAGGVPVSLGTLGANDSTAMSINAAGDVAGYSVNATNATRAFIFTDGGGMRDIGVIQGHAESRAFSINDTGLVVGTSEDAAGNVRAFLWNSSGALLDLNPLIPPNSGFVLNEAQDINNGGDIVGNGLVGGLAHAYIIERFEGLDTLTPIVSASVPAPINNYPSSVVTMNYWDNEKVVADTTHVLGMIRVTGPNGYDAVATQQSYYFADRQAGNSMFTFIPPGGSWNGADNGTYEIRLAPNVLSDLAGNLHPGGVIGTFTVGIQTAPTLALSGLPTTTTLGTSVNLTFTATGSYPAAAGDVFAVTIDWDGDGGDLQTVNATSNTAIPHTFTVLGTHTARVTVTDPHALTSSQQTMQCVVTNTALLPLISSVRAEQTGYFGGMNNVRAVEKAGTFYFFGGLPLSNDNTPAVTWNYTTAGQSFIFRGDLDNGPIYPEGAALDGRGRICVWGGAGTEGGTTANAMTYTIAGGVGGGIVDKPTANPGVSARDNLGRLYSISSNIAYRYDAGVSGNGVWSTLAAPPNIACSAACYDGAGRIIVFGGSTAWAYSIAGNSWAQLANSPVAMSSPATLGADGLVYLVAGTTVYAFNPATSTTAALGRTNYDHSALPAALGTDGLLYLFGASYVGGASNIETINTNPAATLAPRIASTPSGTTTLSVGNAWTYAVAASGKPAPAFSIASGPAGMTVGAANGLVSWTPATAGTFTARVRATNSAGVAEQMFTLTVLGTPPDTTLPTPPTNLAAFNITTTSADLQWSPGSDNIGVVAYRLKTSHRGGTRWRRTTTYPTFGTTTGLTWHVTASVGAVVNYYIVSVDAAGNESTRAMLTVAFIAPPAISVNNTGTFYGTRAIVSEPWIGNVFTAAGNPVPTLTAGTAPAGAVWHSIAANSGYYTWTAIAGQEGPQTFTVNATNTGGSASLSQAVTAYPAGTDLIPPGYVGSLVVDQVSFDSCRVTWTDATDNYGVTGYRVSAVHREGRRRFHRGPYNDHVVSFNVPAGTTQVTIPGLRPSTAYIVSVVATDAAGLWGYAASRDIRTLLQPFVVSTAQTTTTDNGDGSMTLSWPGYGYYWKFTVECSTDLLAWAPVEPASQWPSYATAFTFTPDGSPQKFYRVKAIPAAAP